MSTFKLLGVLLWCLIVAVTGYAIYALGSDGGMVFLSDLAHPWRAQFNTDLMIHLLLFASWVVWREQSRAVGAVCALLCLMGGLFTLPYLLWALHRAGGDAKALLLGAHAPARA